VSAFQRSAHRPIRYWAWTRCGDALAGFADRDHRKPEDTQTTARLHDAQPSTASSPWLDRLSAEYVGAVEEERLAAMAAISVLSAQWVAARQAAAQSAEDAELARTRQTKLGSEQVDSTPMTAGEHYETPTAILSRRLTTRRRQDAELSAELGRLTAQHARSLAAMTNYADAIAAHWNALLIRVAALAAYYTRRAGTYTRRRRDWRLPNLRSPVMETPSWAEHPCPWSPGAAAGDTTPASRGALTDLLA
jgi:hypothetical protein